MKKIIAYVNTLRVHWLVEEMGKIGINEIMVTEYFSPNSQISRFVFLCNDDAIEKAREIIHRIGTTGSLADHFFEVYDVDPNAPDTLSLGQRISPLEE
ncbi:MAG: hypothetical protein HY707_04385 [Ignavibacteriae bacterium]|nr:hypothetical protein [Ignavibacteriota bacterium]